MDGDLVTVGDALAIVRERGIAIEEWSQAVADGTVQSWPSADGRLRVRRSDAECWRPRVVSLVKLDDLVGERSDLEQLIYDEVLRLRHDGVSCADIAEVLHVSERDAQLIYEPPPG